MKIYFLMAGIIMLASCEKFLDKKPNKDWVIPTTLNDAAALLDGYFTFNENFPNLGLQADDNFYLKDDYWNTLRTINQDNYCWNKELYNKAEWKKLYSAVLQSNVARETTEKIKRTDKNSAEWDRIIGSVYFHRGNAFLTLAQYYTPPYDESNANQPAGIPLRLTSNINEATKRSSIAQTWQQILSDLKIAAYFLPKKTIFPSRPTKQAAYAILANAYLNMEDYGNALLYADSCLKIQGSLIDYNTINPNASIPFPKFNQEVIFSATATGAAMLSYKNWHCDSVLFNSYEENDLRRTCLYKSNGPGTWGFKGNYDGTTSTVYFVGPAVDEMYLIKAECEARLNRVEDAMTDLNSLLITRWKSGTFIPFTASTSEEALQIVLTERRKELVMRGSRWFDLRRLNKDPRFAKTLTRLINGTTYTLDPGDKRYTHYIPLDVIALSGIEQNER